jgi:rhomboid protease GluP
MKEGFIRSLTGDFITRRDFMPLKDEAGNIVAGDVVSILTKQSFGSLVILELIDADRLSTENISAILEGNAKRLDNINAAQCYVFEVFIFDAGPEEDKRKAIEDGQLHRAVQKKYIKCMSVNLEDKTLLKYFNAPVTDFGISAAVNARLGEDGEPSEYEGRLEDIVHRREEERKIVYRAKTPVLTYALIAVNIIVFGLLKLYSMQSGKSYDELLSIFGSKINSYIINGEYWRFITPVFLHANEVHLFINCYSLYAVGVTVEKVFGHTRFFFIYFFAGLLGNVFSFMFSLNPAVGASGAIFGLLGALLYFGLERPALFRAYFGYGVIVTIVINLFYGFSKSGIDNYAHMGGLLGGFLATGAVNASAVRKWYLNRLLYILLALAIASGGMLYGFTNGNNLALGKLDKIRTFIDNNNYSEAEKAAEELLAARPGDRGVRSDVLRTLIWAEASSGKLDESLQHALMLAETDPPSGHYLAGLLYYDLERYDEAKRELLAAKELKAPYDNIDELLSSIEGLTAK